RRTCSRCSSAWASGSPRRPPPRPRRPRLRPGAPPGGPPPPRAGDREDKVQGAILSVLAHPDDAEFLCAGALTRLAREHGWRVHIASMTPGDCGSAELDALAIAKVRRAEGARAAAVIGATYHCLEERDLLIFYAERPLEMVVRLIRAVRPRVLLTHSPADYMLD